MYKTSSNFSMSSFRNRVLVWMLIVVLSFSLVPSASMAQQPTATTSEMNIEDIQSSLQQLGYNLGPIDGIMGKKTTAAIKAFQTDMNLPVDGKPSAELLELLQRETVKLTGPTATIRALSGTVLVNGQQTDIGTVLSAGDVIETQAGASVVLELSDGSELQLGENTNIDIAVLARDPDTGARVSWVKLLWGKIRAFLSPGHQKVGSAFTFETPNALVGVKFSQPDVELKYDPKTDTSIIAAHTVAVIVTNRQTGESKEITKKQRGIVKRDSISISTLSSKELTIFPKMPPIIRKKPPTTQKRPPGQDKSKDKPDKPKDKPDKPKDKPDKPKDKPDKSKDKPDKSKDKPDKPKNRR